MIEDARKIPHNERLSVDLCIVGGGAAAITLALHYMKSGRSVILLPGGGTNQTATCIDLYRGMVTPKGSHEPLEENRLRMWGGTTTVWGGRCLPFDAIDYEDRGWVDHSGWPVTQSELDKFITLACELCEVGRPEFNALDVFPKLQGEILSGFDNEDMVSWPLERWSIPTDFSRRYEPEIRCSPNLRVLLHSHAVHLQMDKAGKSLSHVVAATTPHHKFNIEASDFVLACGALENARLLLAANDVLPCGIGNQYDLVGRYYQSHRFGVCGYAVLNDPNKNFIYDFEKDSDGVYCRRRFWLTPSAQEKHGTTNAVGFFFRSVSDGSEHRNAMVSLVLVIKTLLGGARKGPKRLFGIIRYQRKELTTHFKIILKDGPSIFGQLAAVAYTRFFQKRRLPMILPPRKYNRFPLFYQTEHAPNYESRVTLDESSRDEFGMPRLDVRIRFSDIDYRTIRTFVEIFSHNLEASGQGTFHLSDSDLRFLENPEKQQFNSNSHNIGTTRMSLVPEDGVVDTDCKVHGIDNLYLAGSSVFPTSGHANPTLMIVALALRLAETLVKRR